MHSYRSQRQAWRVFCRAKRTATADSEWLARPLCDGCSRPVRMRMLIWLADKRSPLIGCRRLCACMQAK